MHASRRDFLRSSGMGFGSIALAGLLARDGVTGPLPTHFPARAKRVIHVFLNGIRLTLRDFWFSINDWF